MALLPPGLAKPVVDPISEPFWRGLGEHVLKVQRCDACSLMVWPPSGGCPRCLGGGLEWVALSGAGHLRSFIQMHQPIFPGWRDRIPYNVVLVAAEEDRGVLFVANLHGGDPEEVGLEGRVRAVFVHSEEQTLLGFEPA